MHNLAGGVRQGGGGDNGQAGFLQDLATQLDVGAFEAHHQRPVQAHFARRTNDAFGDRVAAHHAAEHIHENPLHARIVEDQLEGAGDAFLGGGAGDVHEVGRLAAVMLNDVHGGHGEAGAVHHAADVAFQLHVVEIVARGFELERVHLVDVAHLHHVDEMDPLELEASRHDLN